MKEMSSSLGLNERKTTGYRNHVHTAKSREKTTLRVKKLSPSTLRPTKRRKMITKRKFKKKKRKGKRRVEIGESTVLTSFVCNSDLTLLKDLWDFQEKC